MAVVFDQLRRSAALPPSVELRVALLFAVAVPRFVLSGAVPDVLAAPRDAPTAA